LLLKRTSQAHSPVTKRHDMRFWRFWISVVSRDFLLDTCEGRTEDLSAFASTYYSSATRPEIGSVSLHAPDRGPGTTWGAFVFQSADRTHLKWETNLGAPKAWKMSLSPSEATAETIPGDPSHLDFAAAENELALLASRRVGQHSYLP
jgi:hypothetical protein